MPSSERIKNEPAASFRGRKLPVPCYLAGYAALMDRYDLRVPLHHEMAAVASKNTRRREDGWAIYPHSSDPGHSTIDHLIFALKYEGVQLLTLKAIFGRFDRRELEEALRSKPTSAYLRRLGFLNEWLMQEVLDVPNTRSGTYVDLIDTKRQYATRIPRKASRFRINDNLPGTPAFCPTVTRTHKIDDYIGKRLDSTALSIVDSAPKELIGRAAAFLLLSDSKASFAIEGENPPKDRLARWGQTIGKAGKIFLDIPSLVALQRELVGDGRFVRLGLRTEGGFVGRHDPLGQPIPDHISAAAKDIEGLLDGIDNFDFLSDSLDFHPVLAAACIAFGFVYIHPFEDGNGRIHRFMMHHVLAARHYTPKGIVFPISSVILGDIVGYKSVLESVSRPLLAWIDWRPTLQGNVEIIGETADFYRYFDATAHVEFLFKCIEQAVEKDLSEELAYLEIRDQFHARATMIVDMPERRLDLLFRFLRQGHGRLSKRALENEFKLLTAREVEAFEALYGDLLQG